MDEPTASLDFGNQIRLLEKIRQLRHRQISLIITTHNPQQAMFLAQDILLLDQQYGAHQGAREMLLTTGQLAKIYRVSEAQLTQYLWSPFDDN